MRKSNGRAMNYIFPKLLDMLAPTMWSGRCEVLRGYVLSVSAYQTQALVRRVIAGRIA